VPENDPIGKGSSRRNTGHSLFSGRRAADAWVKAAISWQGGGTDSTRAEKKTRELGFKRSRSADVSLFSRD